MHGAMNDETHYLTLASAFVRGRLPDLPPLEGPALLEAGVNAGLRLHKFKRTAGLPRVRRVLGMLAQLQPQRLLDVGSGRGAFLWPLLDAFPELEVIAVDRKPLRVSDLEAVRQGGIANLDPREMDATDLTLQDGEVDGATLLEVLEHMDRPLEAMRHAVRVSQRFVIASVPSKEDENPEHIHLFDAATLERMFIEAGAKRVRFEYVLNHIIALATP